VVAPGSAGSGEIEEARTVVFRAPVVVATPAKGPWLTELGTLTICGAEEDTAVVGAEVAVVVGAAVVAAPGPVTPVVAGAAASGPFAEAGAGAGAGAA
jgi:hypothetical protein